jgi:protein-tyrosine-phosphatase
MKTVLFVCTGNVFRSFVAEVAFKAHIREQGRTTDFVVGSAGTQAIRQVVPRQVRELLSEHGVDTRGHIQRLLTRNLAESSDYVIAMSDDHQRFILEHFGRQVPLFSELSRGYREPIRDLREAVPNWERYDRYAHLAPHARHPLLERIVRAS